jgi:predicted nucleic acid-binding protein
VAAKWYLPVEREFLTTQAAQVQADYSRRKIELIVPDLFWPEFGNVFWKAVWRKRISRITAEAAIRLIESSGIRSTPSEPLLGPAFQIATEYNRTLYDAIYVALAAVNNMPLLTADDRLANALAAHFPVRWLGAYAQ